MTPFLQFRYWLRRASATSRASVAVSIAVVLALVSWVAIPADNSTTPAAAAPAGTATESTAPGPMPSGTTPSTGVSGPAPIGPVATGPGAPGQHPTSTNPSGQPFPSASASRQTCTTRGAPVKIGVVLIELGQGGANVNDTFGIPSTSEQRADYNAMFDTVNKAGGVQCHPLVGDFETYNEFSPPTSTTACNNFVANKVFAVMGGFLPTASDACLMAAKLPTFETTPLPRDDMKRFSPYLWSASGVIERNFVNFAHVMSQNGYFGAKKKFTKLGIFYRDCIPNIYEHFVAGLRAVGVTSAQITKYNVGCPSAIATPADDQAAVTQFRNQNVSTVVPLSDGGDIQGFTNVAQSQGFRPQYLIADTQEVAVVSGANFAPNQPNFNGALALTAQAYGSLGSNLPESAATKSCDAIMVAHGLPTVRKSGNEFAGAVCSFVWILVAAMQHNPDGSKAGLVKGIQAVGRIELSEPEGPADYSKPGTTAGGQFWRTVKYSSACACWKVLQDFQPSFSDAG
jgi:hypothetical protein